MQPLETEFGRKRTIEQSSCNKDFSCLEGFCPSFVTVHGARLKEGTAVSGAAMPAVPEPQVPTLDTTMGVLITGVGGTGVVTVGAVLGMAAHLDGLGVGIIDMAGLAQKGGAVTTHMKIAPRPEDIHSIRVAAEEADTVLACDIVVAGSKKALTAIRPGESRVFVNLHETYPGDFTRDADFSLPTRRLKRAIEERVGAGRAHFVEAQRLAGALMGDAIAANMFMVGFAWQQGGLADIARVDPGGDPAERRRGGDERGRLRMGPARRARPGRGGACGGRSAGGGEDADARRDRRAAGRVPDGLSERRLCRALPSADRADRRGRAARRAGRDDARDRGRRIRSSS